MSKHLFSDVSLSIKGAGCTVFTVRNSKDEVLFCRNYDFPYSPSLQLFTAPCAGHASVSTVNLMFMGYAEENLPFGLNINSFLTVLSPYLPMDGVNEKGLAIALLSVPIATPTFNDIILNTSTSIRLVLDKASTVEEAIELLEQYNIYFSQDIYVQFMIADASGKSAIVNYWDDNVKVTTVDSAYQIAANFIPYNGLNISEGDFAFERYDKVKAVSENNSGVLSEKQAADLLVEVGSGEGLQWSVVYNISTLEGNIFAGGC